MRRTLTYPFLLLGVFLFVLMNLPKGGSDKIRLLAVSPFRRSFFEENSDDLTKLQIENQTLKAQIDHAYEWLLSDLRLSEQLDVLKELEKHTVCEQRSNHLREILRSQLVSIPAQVIYRDPSSWSSCIWVNVGDENNAALGKTVVSKNSPVIADGALVGVIDYVGKKQSRIRLITDSGLAPAVRVNRGATQNRELARQLHVLLQQLEKRDDLFSSQEEKEKLFASLNNLREKNGVCWEDGYLAKGEVHGSSAPFWRSRSPVLKGIGFHFDYLDKERISPDAKIPILKEGDLLVTSGLDGIFPPGFPVGFVSSVDPIKEGGYFYNIEVKPAVNNLNDLRTVFILPSLSE
jgi:rod shape-determining protein MreC